LAHSDTILLAGIMLALAIGVSLMAKRLRVPGLVFFLVLGVAVGPHGLEVVDLLDPELARTVGVMALALILFEGGLSSGWKEIRPVIWPSLSLATIGTVGTAVITGLGASWLLGFSTLEGMLLGAIVASTDGAAVFALLRGSSLRRRLARTLEAEAGLNDPVAVILVLGFIEWIRRPDYGIQDMLLLFGQEMVIGAAVGLAIGSLAAFGLKRVGFSATGLYPVASIATVAVAFGLGDTLHGSGFLAVYLAGLVLGGAQIPASRTISDFHDGLAWVSQIAVFMILGLLIDPATLKSLWDDALIVSIILMLVARPLSVAMATVFNRYEPREMVLLGWAGLRGAVPIVLATFPLIAGTPNASRLFDIVFYVVLASAALQGTTFEWMAKRLKLTTSLPAVRRPLIQVGNIRRLGAEVYEYPVQPADAIAGRSVSELQLPREALVSVIVRDAEALLPRGSTEIEPGDRLHILVRGSASKRVEDLFALWREGPIGEIPTTIVRPVTGRSAIFSVRPWTQEMGDPGSPETIGKQAVYRRLRTRHDQPGVLVILEDGRFAVTGDGIVAVGSPTQLRVFASRRIQRAATGTARAWWQEVAGAVSHTSIT
jgi:cell volume regulation protein A